MKKELLKIKNGIIISILFYKKRMKIVFPDFIDLPKEIKLEIKKLGEVTIYNDIVNNEDEITKRIKGAEIITANYINITANIIRQSPNLKYIIVPAVAYDWIDAQATTKNSIKIINCPTYNSQAVVEHAIGLMFAVSRRIVEAHNLIKSGIWSPKELRGVELAGKNLLVIGFGNIGKKVYSIAVSIGMKCQYVNSKSTDKEIDVKIKWADFILLAVALNEKTKGMFGERRINLMKKSAILVNVSRGLIIDNEYLIEALSRRSVLGAGIDVFPDDNTIKKPTPLIKEYTKLSNVVLTPHIGYNTEESSLRLGQELIEDIKYCIKNKPRNVVLE